MATEDQPHTTVIRTDEPVSIHVGEGGDGRWFRLFHAIVTQGVVGKLTAAEARTLIVLAAHAGNDWEAWPGVDRIAEQANLTSRGVRKALTQLEKFGLIARVQAGGGRKRTTIWRLTEPRPQRPAAPKTLNRRSVNTGSGIPQKPGTGVPQNPERVFRGTRLKELDSNSSPSLEPPAATAGDPETDPEILDALTAAEIGEPARSRLAALEGMTAGLVERTVRKCQDKPGGVLIRALEAAAEAAVVRRRRAAERKVREGVGGAPPEEPVATGEDREQGLAQMREALGRRGG